MCIRDRDAICDGKDVLIPGIMEHIERAGIHSGDSISVYPAVSLSPRLQQKMIDTTIKLAHELHVVGMINIQYIVYANELYLICLLYTSYAYYHAVRKGKAPKNAPTYRKEATAATEKKTCVCTVCGYVYEGSLDSMPEDYQCPICKNGKSFFKEQ